MKKIVRGYMTLSMLILTAARAEVVKAVLDARRGAAVLWAVAPVACAGGVGEAVVRARLGLGGPHAHECSYADGGHSPPPQKKAGSVAAFVRTRPTLTGGGSQNHRPITILRDDFVIHDFATDFRSLKEDSRGLARRKAEKWGYILVGAG